MTFFIDYVKYVVKVKLMLFPCAHLKIDIFIILIN